MGCECLWFYAPASAFPTDGMVAWTSAESAPVYSGFVTGISCPCPYLLRKFCRLSLPFCRCAKTAKKQNRHGTPKIHVRAVNRSALTAAHIPFSHSLPPVIRLENVPGWSELRGKSWRNAYPPTEIAASSLARATSLSRHCQQRPSAKYLNHYP